MRKKTLGVYILIGFLFAVGVIKIPIRDHIDRDGYLRDPSLWALLFPQIEGAYRASIIKSVQTGAFTILDSGTTSTITITSVNTGSAITILQGRDDSNGGTVCTDSSVNWAVRLELTNPTTLTWTRGGTASIGTHSTGVYEVVEFYPSVVKSLQRGTISIASASTSNSVTISSVITTKSMMPWQGFENDCNTSWSNETPRNAFIRSILTNATTITATRYTTSSCAAVIVPYEVLEFK